MGEMESWEQLVDPEADDELRSKIRRLLAHVRTSDVHTIQARVAWILDRYPDARDSDIELQLRFWEHFEGIPRGLRVSQDEYGKLTRLTSIARARATIQNQYRLFSASPEVQQRRRKLAEGHRQAAQTAPTQHVPEYVFCFDESGKTDDHLIIGAVLILSNLLAAPLFLRLQNLQLQLGQGKRRREFHFKNIKKNSLGSYLQLIVELSNSATACSYGYVILPRRGIADRSAAFRHMTLRLITEMVSAHHESGRAKLPRRLGVLKDEEEAGYDRLFLSRLTSELETTDLVREDGLSVDWAEAESSAKSLPLQLADLIAASARRSLAGPDAGETPKDQFASKLLDSLGIRDPRDADTTEIYDRMAKISLKSPRAT